jgi:hypothetical protein
MATPLALIVVGVLAILRAIWCCKTQMHLIDLEWKSCRTEHRRYRRAHEWMGSDALWFIKLWIWSPAKLVGDKEHFQRVSTKGEQL